MWYPSQLLRDQRGNAVIEFAFIFPILIVFLFGTIELTNMLMNQRRVVAATQSLADLVARDASISLADLSDLEDAVEWQMEPFGVSNANYTVGQVVFDDGSAALDWSHSVGGTGIVNEGDMTSSVAGLTDSTAIIVVRFEYQYQPVVGQLILGDSSGITFTETALSHPRLSASITCDGC